MWFTITILIMVLVFGVLIFIHEAGHFMTARACGVTVREFAIGMGPTIFHWNSKKHGTRYGLRLLPIGGFVSMEGEDEASDSEGAFCNKSVPKRMLIVVAGALMNLLLGFLLMAIMVFSQGNLGSNVIGRFEENAVSNQQLQVNDRVVKVGNTSVHTWEELAYEVMNQGYRPVDITVIRDGEKIRLEDVSFQPLEESGATFGNCDFIPYAEERTFGNLMKHTFYRSLSTVKMVYDSLFGMISGRFGLDAVSGPVGVAGVVGTAARAGILNLVYIVAVLSINLGIFNLIPFPALDGGRFLFLIIEGIRGKKINPKIESYINFAGLVILFAFMIFITCKDILKLIF